MNFKKWLIETGDLNSWSAGIGDGEKVRYNKSRPKDDAGKPIKKSKKEKKIDKLFGKC